MDEDLTTASLSPEPFTLMPSIPSHLNGAVLLCSFNKSCLIIRNVASSYFDNNCAAEFPDGGFGAIKNPQDIFPEYLTHASGQKIVAPLQNSAGLAQQFSKEFMMFETNTASCGGFPGVSDSFGSALWAVDYGLQLAYSNFTGALLHIGGSNTTYSVCRYRANCTPLRC